MNKSPEPDLSVTIAGIRMANPVMTASGTFGYGQEYHPLFDLKKLGALVTKGISLNPMAGNPPPRICESAGGMLNAIGLQNVGVEVFLRDKLPFSDQTGDPGDCQHFRPFPERICSGSRTPGWTTGTFRSGDQYFLSQRGPGRAGLWGRSPDGGPGSRPGATGPPCR